jgi:hypothetical protein
VTTRNLPFYRDPAVLLIDQLKQVYIDGELEETHRDRTVTRAKAGRHPQNVAFR